jgi:hypothetical protein
MKGLTQYCNQHIVQVVKLLFKFGTDQESAKFRQVLFLGLHFNLMLTFTTQALQDPPLCSNTM